MGFILKLLPTNKGYIEAMQGCPYLCLIKLRQKPKSWLTRSEVENQKQSSQ